MKIICSLMIFSKAFCLVPSKQKASKFKPLTPQLLVFYKTSNSNDPALKTALGSAVICISALLTSHRGSLWVQTSHVCFYSLFHLRTLPDKPYLNTKIRPQSIGLTLHIGFSLQPVVLTGIIEIVWQNRLSEYSQRILCLIIILLIGLISMII